MHRLLGRLTLLTVLAITAAVAAEDKKEKKKKGGPGTIYSDPKNAGPDYELQGEFQGKLEIRDGGQKVGVQVIALGGGKFRMVGHIGGLPGDGYDERNDEAKKIVEGQRAGDKIVFSDDEGVDIIVMKDKLTVVKKDDGKSFGELKRVHRKSKTLGLKPPGGAVVLFNGKSADAFVRGKLLPGGLLGANCESKEKFGDHVLHLEFRTPFKPYDRGQARGNSGMYLQSRYEVQILDSFGLEGKNNECGGLYSIKEPHVNMCYPPLTWQTYDAEFTAARYKDGKKVKNARLTLRHNGFVIHDNVELPKGTPGKAGEGAEPLGLYLQGHGNPVVFRNVWVVKK